MSQAEFVVRGHLKADGTLDLTERPAIPAGPVEVVIRPIAPLAATKEHWWSYLQRARADLEAAGHRFRTREEIDVDLREIRSADSRVEDA